MKRLATFFALSLLLAFGANAQRYLKDAPKVAGKMPQKGLAAMDELVPSVPGAPGETGLGFRSAEEKQIGTAFNLYSILLDGQNQVVYNPELNTVAFVHRQNNGAVGGSGVVSYDLSTDGGITWDSETKQVTPSLEITPGQQNNGHAERSHDAYHVEPRTCGNG